MNRGNGEPRHETGLAKIGLCLGYLASRCPPNRRTAAEAEDKMPVSNIPVIRTKQWERSSEGWTESKPSQHHARLKEWISKVWREAARSAETRTRSSKALETDLHSFGFWYDFIGNGKEATVEHSPQRARHQSVYEQDECRIGKPVLPLILVRVEYYSRSAYLYLWMSLSRVTSTFTVLLLVIWPFRSPVY